MVFITDDERVMATSQILYGQCHIWDIYVLGLKPIFFLEKTTNAQNHGQGTHNAMMGAVVWPKISQMPHNLSTQFVCPSPKVRDIIEKKLRRASVVRGFDNQ